MRKEDWALILTVERNMSRCQVTVSFITRSQWQDPEDACFDSVQVFRQAAMFRMRCLLFPNYFWKRNIPSSYSSLLGFYRYVIPCLQVVEDQRSLRPFNSRVLELTCITMKLISLVFGSLEATPHETFTMIVRRCNDYACMTKRDLVKSIGSQSRGEA